MLGRFGTAIGFDLSSVGLQYSRQAGSRLIVTASVAEVPFADQTFDVVAAFDVLYALDEDTESRAVKEIHRVLRPGGSAIINVAALPILRGTHAAFGGEQRRSTRRRLRALLESSGFTVTRLTYTNASIFPLVLAVRITQRLSGLASHEETSSDIAVPPRIINGALRWLLSLEARAMKFIDMPIGSSLLCVANKS